MLQLSSFFVNILGIDILKNLSSIQDGDNSAFIVHYLSWFCFLV